MLNVNEKNKTKIDNLWLSIIMYPISPKTYHIRNVLLLSNWVSYGILLKWAHSFYNIFCVEYVYSLYASLGFDMMDLYKESYKFWNIK